MVYNREEAAKRAEASYNNVPGTCQMWTDSIFGAPAVGDFDHNGDASAVDGWKSEPAAHKHPGDRNPPRGVPVSWSGGSHGYGHRAVSLGGGKIRSTDAGGSGKIATVDLAWPERTWGLTYSGWSETISGIMIPMPPTPSPTRISLFLEGGPRYDLKLLDSAIQNGRVSGIKSVRDEIDHQVARLRHIKPSVRITRFLHIYDTTRVIRLGLLSKSIKAGRVHVVKDVRARIMRSIYKLPPR